MCKCCAPINKGLAIFFTLSRLFFVGISTAALIQENELHLKPEQKIVNSRGNGGLFVGYLIYAIINFFTLWSTFCCVNEEEKECCKYSDDTCCTCICFSGQLCFFCDLGDDNLNFLMCGVMLFLFFFRFYVWILVKCCGKRSRYCIQIFSITYDILYAIILIVAYEKFSVFFIITIVLFLLSGLSTIIIFIYINVNYRKELKNEEILKSSLNNENLVMHDNPTNI